MGRTPTPILSTRGGSPGANTPTVFSPRFDVKTRSGFAATSAPATALRPGMEPTYFCASTSMTSTASFAVCAT